MATNMPEINLQEGNEGRPSFSGSESFSARPLSSGAPLRRSPKQSNLSVENEKQQSNLSVENEKQQSNLSVENEKQQSNLSVENVKQQSNLSVENGEPNEIQNNEESTHRESLEIDIKMNSGTEIEVHETNVERRATLSTLVGGSKQEEFEIQPATVTANTSRTSINQSFDTTTVETTPDKNPKKPSIKPVEQVGIKNEPIVKSTAPITATTIPSPNSSKGTSITRTTRTLKTVERGDAGGDISPGSPKTTYKSVGYEQGSVASYQASLLKSKAKSHLSRSRKPKAKIEPKQPHQPKPEPEPEPEQPSVMAAAGMGAISFKVPGRITHKTTIKIAHYPQAGNEIITVEQPMQCEGYPEEYQYGEDCYQCPNGNYSNNCNFATYNMNPYAGNYYPYGYHPY